MSETVEIRLSKGYIAIVDEIDSDLEKLKWAAVELSHTVYASRGGSANLPKEHLHRVIMERIVGRSLDEDEFPDHKNRNGLDNRRENLRLASRSQNAQNKRAYRNNKSGYKGVSWDKRNSKWHARIVANGELYLLGRFTSKDDAARAYNRAAVDLHGEFAYQNVIPEDA